MDWVLARKDAIENALAARHLANGTLVLYDVSSAAFEGHTCPLGAIGHARDGVKGRLQIVYGLLCSPAGVPIAIEVFDGNTADPKTLAAQIDKLKTRFGLTHIALVGDRGMLTSARIRDELRPAAAGLDQRAARPADQGPGRRRGAAAVAVRRAEPVRDHPPRLPRRAAGVLPQPGPGRRARPQTRTSCWRPPKHELQTIATATRRARQPLRGQDKIALRVGKVRNKFKMAKHFHLDITDEAFTFTRNQDASPPRPPLTASTCCAPACPTRHFSATRSCCATKTSPTSNASSAPSTPNSTCAPSGIGSPTGCARTCSYACCPTTSAGT